MRFSKLVITLHAKRQAIVPNTKDHRAGNVRKLADKPHSPRRRENSDRGKNRKGQGLFAPAQTKRNNPAGFLSHRHPNPKTHGWNSPSLTLTRSEREAEPEEEV